MYDDYTALDYGLHLVLTSFLLVFISLCAIYVFRLFFPRQELHSAPQRVPSATGRQNLPPPPPPRYKKIEKQVGLMGRKVTFVLKSGKVIQTSLLDTVASSNRPMHPRQQYYFSPMANTEHVDGKKLLNGLWVIANRNMEHWSASVVQCLQDNKFVISDDPALELTNLRDERVKFSLQQLAAIKFGPESFVEFGTVVTYKAE